MANTKIDSLPLLEASSKAWRGKSYLHADTAVAGGVVV
jgi:hypothetical protein